MQVIVHVRRESVEGRIRVEARIDLRSVRGERAYRLQDLHLVANIDNHFGIDDEPQGVDEPIADRWGPQYRMQHSTRGRQPDSGIRAFSGEQLN